MSTIGNWIKQNITGNRGSGYTSDRQLDQQGDQIKNDINNIKDTVDQLNKPVEVSLEGSYDNLSKKDKLILGATAGAVVGGGVGALKGMVEAAGDGMKLDPHWETHDINQPKVSVETVKQNIPGTTQVATADGLQDVQVSNASLRYHFEPKITYEKVGEYKTPGTVEPKFEFTTNAVMEGAKFAAIGAGVGVVGTAAYMALEHIKHKDDKPDAKPPVEVTYGDEKKTIIKAGVVGAVVGGAVGAVDATMEKIRATGSETIKWEVPVMEKNVKIGEVPQDASVMIRQDVRYSDDAFKNSKLYNDPSKFDLEKHMKKAETVDVMGDKPDKKLLGGVKMEEKSATYKAEARYGMVGSVLGGIALGGVLGVASGVALNILKKMVNS